MRSNAEEVAGDGVAREKATFLSWVTMKQQESQNMTEAAALCSKPLAVTHTAPMAAAEAQAEENAIPVTSTVRTGLKVL